ncbi:unnamed protein product [Rotaria socialis]|uniref:Uncharacterized protein n=1 Tax=Rotaria socialis TaxID=392032 RepID=A0A820I357_9BILA|nr:unnamed protein product [Rotaria socialis]
MHLLLEHYEEEKVAALYIFQICVNRALKILNDGLSRGSSIRATSTNNDDKTFINEFSSATKLFHQPCVRTMFEFVLKQNRNDRQYECVLANICIGSILQ